MELRAFLVITSLGPPVRAYTFHNAIFRVASKPFEGVGRGTGTNANVCANASPTGRTSTSNPPTSATSSTNGTFDDAYALSRRF